MSIRLRLIGLVLSVLMPVAVIAVAGTAYAWRTGRQTMERELLLVAQGTAADVVRELEISKGTLVALATSPFLQTGELERFHNQVEQMPRLDGVRITLADEAGQVQVNVRLPYGVTLPVRAERAVVGRVFATGEPQVSDLYVAPMSREHLVSIDVPVKMNGNVTYDLAMSYPPSVLAQVLARQALPASKLVSIIDGNDVILARSVEDQAFVGRRVADASIAAFAEGNTIYTTTSQEGFPILAAAVRVPGTGWRVAAYTRLDLVNMQMLRSLTLILAAFTGFFALGMLVAVHHATRIARPIEALAGAALAIGRGGAMRSIPRGVSEASRAGEALARSVIALAERARERDNAEAAQRHGETKLAQLLATTPAGVLEFNSDRELIYANKAAERILRAPPGALTDGSRTDHDWQQRTLDGAKMPAEHLPTTRALRGETVTAMEYLATALDGRQVALLAEVVPIRTPGDTGEPGPIVGALAAFQDVTGMHLQAQALRESEARFRQMADSAPALIWMSDSRGEVVFANKHYETIFGRPAADMLGRGWESTLLPADLEPYREAFREAFVARRPFRNEGRVHDLNGETRSLLCQAVPRTDETGTFLGYTGCCVDVTEARMAAETLERRVGERTAALSEALDQLQIEVLDRQQAEAKLRQSQKMQAVGQLTGGIAHDFNNMLQAIGGSLELVQRRVDQGRAGETAKYVLTAKQTVDRAAALTHRLLAFSRQQSLQTSDVRPNSLVSDMVELIRRTVGAGVTVDMQLGVHCRTVSCDPNQLENVLLNLAINARDAMPTGGRLLIAVRDVALGEDDLAGQQDAVPGDYVEISVADTGSGMDEDTRARAFEPFFTTKPLGQGTGLGLSQIYGFVRQSGGIVQLESAPGAGTTVRVLLPRQAAVVNEAAAPTKQTEDAATGETVLLVEDEAGVRAVAADHLRDLGYVVLEAADGPAALRLLSEPVQIDLLMTDVGLSGGMNGRHVADAAREHRPHLPVLFVTGYAGSALDEALEPGMAVIGKPYPLQALAIRVKDMLAMAAAE